MVARWVQWWWSDPGGETHQERHMVHRGVWCTLLHSYMVHHGDIHTIITSMLGPAAEHLSTLTPSRVVQHGRLMWAAGISGAAGLSYPCSLLSPGPCPPLAEHSKLTLLYSQNKDCQNLR